MTYLLEMGGKTSNTRLLTYSTKVPRVASLGPRPHNSLLNRLAGIPNSEQTARRNIRAYLSYVRFARKADGEFGPSCLIIPT